MFTTNISEGSHCQFLFGKEGIKFETIEIEETLKEIESISIQAFKDKNIFLFDALAANDQCHFIAQIVSDLYTRTKKEEFSLKKGDRSPESKFIQLTVLLSSLFLRNKEQTLPFLCPKKETKHLYSLLKNESIKSEARKQLSEIIRAYVASQFTNVLDDVQKELKSLSEETGLNNYGKSVLHAYPKFSGVMLLMQKEKASPVIFKIKVLCPEGTHTQLFGAKNFKSLLTPLDQQTNLDFASSAIVVEGIANRTGKEFHFSNFNTNRSLCPQGFMSEDPKKTIVTSEGKKKVHLKDKYCSLCTSCPTGEKCKSFSQYLHDVNSLKLTPEKVLMHGGADFTAENQITYKDSFFAEKGNYPCLTKIFLVHQKQSLKLGISCKNPEVLMIEHVYPDTVGHAVKTKRLLDSKPLELLKKENF